MTWFRIVLAVSAVVIALSVAGATVAYVMDQRADRPAAAKGVTKPGVNAPKLRIYDLVPDIYGPRPDIGLGR